MKQKIIDFLSKHRYPLALVAIIVIIAVTLYFVLPGENVTDQIIQQQQTNANAAKQTAANANVEAVKSDTARQVEDQVREKVIIPKIETARSRSKRSKESVTEAERKYENEKSNIENLNNSHADNRARLAALFPDIRFEDCQN